MGVHLWKAHDKVVGVGLTCSSLHTFPDGGGGGDGDQGNRGVKGDG